MSKDSNYLRIPYSNTLVMAPECFDLSNLSTPQPGQTIDFEQWAERHEKRATEFRAAQRAATGNHLRWLAQSALWHHQQAQRLLQRKDGTAATQPYDEISAATPCTDV